MNMKPLGDRIVALEKQVKDLQGKAVRSISKNTPVYADNTAALAGGLGEGDLYRTATGDVKVVFITTTTTTTAAPTTTTTTIP